MNKRRLDQESFGIDHEKIGRPYLINDRPAIAYGSIRYNEDGRYDTPKPGTPALVYLCLNEDGSVESRLVTETDEIRRDLREFDHRGLVPVDPNSSEGRAVYHRVLSKLVDLAGIRVH